MISYRLFRVLSECSNRLANKCTVLDKDNKHIQYDLKQSNKDKEKLFKHAFQLIDEVKRLRSKLDNLTSQITCKDISLAEFKAKYATKLEKIKLLQNEIKLLKSKLRLSQKNSLKKGSEIESLKSKIVKLTLKISELKCLKSENISEFIIEEDDKKNIQSKEQSSITKFDDISAVSKLNKNLSQYFVYRLEEPLLCSRKSVDQAGNIDTIILDHSDRKNTPIFEESVIQDYASSPKVDTEIISKMRYSLKALPLPIEEVGAIPIVASTLMLPLLAYIFLTLNNMQNLKTRFPPIKLYLMDMDKATKHESKIKRSSATLSIDHLYQQIR
ncbi:hypothetical protein C2G38_2156772 [Gigaspora rosea]|uniref:Uncharacterized protein n=1 Tax=Gigaspora rosea TaxID=44941 RepID=A0A397W5S1_9GLOM|nr:hypothetical protein C2G38_2156772 [Gigaspora rosea]